MRPSEGEALVSCDTFVVMADCSETGEVRERMSQTLTAVCSRPVSDLSIDFCRWYLARIPTDQKVEINLRNTSRGYNWLLLGEVQEVVFLPAQKYPPGEKLKVFVDLHPTAC